MKRANKKWSEEEEQRLLALFKSGHSWLEIGRKIDRTAEAVLVRLDRLGISRRKKERDKKVAFAEKLSISAHHSEAKSLVDQLYLVGLRRRSGLKRYYRLKPRTREALAEVLLRLNEATSSSGIRMTVSNHPHVDQALFKEFLTVLEENGLVVRVPTTSVIDRARDNLSRRIMKGTGKLEELLLRSGAAQVGRDEDDAVSEEP